MSDTSLLRYVLGYYDQSYPAGAYAPPPVLTSMAPSTVLQSAAATNIVCTGTGFRSGCVVLVDGASPVPTTFQSATQVTLVGYDPNVGGTVQFQVLNPGGRRSNNVAFVVGAGLVREGEDESVNPQADPPPEGGTGPRTRKPKNGT